MTDREIIETFAAEAREHLATVEEEALALERGEADPDRVHRLYRALHTVKGAASFLGLRRPTELCHALEDLVGEIRGGRITPTESVVESLLRGVDKLRVLLDAPTEEGFDIAADVAELERIVADGAAPAEPPPSATPTLEPRPAAVRRESAAPVTSSAPTRMPGASDETVRIGLSLLDRLMNLGSELVLVRNQAMQAIASGDSETLSTIGQRLNVVTSELQASIMQTRMRPVSDVFSKFGRLVRDLARGLGKDILLEIRGAEVELDKNIIEAIRDPMTHLVRNAVDHGIELPAERIERGKSPRGHVSLSAYHQGGQVHIQITDDGQGMAPAALKAEALRRGLVTHEQAEAMVDRDAFNLVFAPGFSTARAVTDVSGRGVGMDVVKSTFSRLGGVIDITSKLGEGSTITVRLPLTLAIVPALIVAVEDACFAVPQVNIDEVVWLHGAEVYQALKEVDDQEVYWLRGKVLPILRLATLLDIDKTYAPPGASPTPDPRAQRPDRRGDGGGSDGERRSGPEERRGSLLNSVYILVLKLGEERFGLLVDRVIDTEEIVVKGLHEHLKDCRAFAGTTVLGDGRIAMILDLAALVDLAGLSISKMESQATTVRSSSAAPGAALVFDVGGSERLAAPLGAITRVEEVARGDIQVASGQEFLARRGGTVPLVRLEHALEEVDASYPEDRVFVIIPRAPRPFGVLAARILDTVEVEADVDTECVATPGVFGSAIVDGRMTLFVDFLEICERVQPGWLGGAVAGPGRARRVLLVEDSTFLAAQVSSFLRTAGFDVVHARNGEQALRRLAAEDVDVVVSDIEMPVMDGLELARRVRGDAATRHLPLYAMSAMIDETIASRARDAGFDGFEPKSDQSRLFEQLLAWCGGEGDS